MKKILVIILIIFLGIGFWYWGKVKENNNRQLFTGQQEVAVVEDGVMVLGARTEAKTVGEFVEQSGLELAEEDKIFPDKKSEIKGGLKIVVERAVPVTIQVDGKEIKKKIFGRIIRDVLKECGVTLNPSDKIEPGLDSYIYDGMEIVVTRIDHKEITEIEEIDFKLVQKKDKKLKWRTTKIKQKGEKGKKEVKYLVTYKNGKEVKRKKLSTEIIKKPVDEITVVGTKITVGKKQRGRASWYAYTGKMAAASTTFPKGTWLRVTAVNSGKQVFVVVNDYGPSPETGKVLDLDKVAFQKLAPLGAGVINVKIEEIK